MSTESATGPAVADLSYEDARDELVAIVARIEGGSVSLEESMQLWERGEALAAHCQAKLDQAQDQLDRATGSAGPADADSGTDADEGTHADEGTTGQADPGATAPDDE